MEPTENQGPYQPRTPPLAEDEKQGLLKSYGVLREALQSVGL